MEGRLIKPPSTSAPCSASPAIGRTRRALAICCVFLLSGFMHELAYFYLTKLPSRNLRWLWFFVAQGPLCILEGIALPREACMPQRKFHACMHIVRTAVVLEALAAPLFFQPTEESGLAAEIVHDAIASFSPSMRTSS